MRKVNLIVSHLVLVLFIIHAVLGAFNLLGVGRVAIQIMTWTMVALIAVHVVIGIILTVKTIRIQKKAGASYFKENRLFWARRISGFVVMVLIFFHIFAFTGVSETHFRLPEFDMFRLITQILLVVSVGVHIITNIKPLYVGTGIGKLKVRVKDVVFWLAVLLAFMAVAFIIYYLRWQAI
ncbi:MAG: pilus assembly protein PilX [Lachnospiraceae bacterium]|nr:pilus assembly protein PilX [Lachnospiraceae bacterium]